jgi:hypothetical protein
VDGYDQVEAAADAARKIEEEDRRNYERQSRARLQRVLATKMRTAFIGALSAVEQAFGELWGYNSPGQRDTKQEKWRQVWEACRGTILNNGNAQLRAVENELTQYTVDWNRCKKTLSVEDES